jgi:hypothetical protein
VVLEALVHGPSLGTLLAENAAGVLETLRTMVERVQRGQVRPHTPRGAFLSDPP